MSLSLDFTNLLGQAGQIINGLFGLAHGGVLGQGWGLGSPQLTPFSFSDFIAASMGEELGLAGLMAILMIYGLIAERGLRIALTCRDAFGKLLAAGLAFSFAQHQSHRRRPGEPGFARPAGRPRRSPRSTATRRRRW